MIVNLDAPLRDLNKNPLPFTPGPEGEPRAATFGLVFVEALMAPQTVNGSPVPIAGAEALKLYQLAQRINEGGTIDLAFDDAALIRNKVQSTFTHPIVVALVWETLGG